MRHQGTIKIQIDDRGRLILPEDVLRQYALHPGGAADLELREKGVVISNSTVRLKRAYVEPTNACNLDCRTCMRQVWNEPAGWMSMDTYQNVLSGLASFSPLPQVFLGGYGEPLAHPQLKNMISMARSAGHDVELITNGILLDEAMAAFLSGSGVSRIWVSLDGATPEGFSDVRLGAELPAILNYLTRLQAVRDRDRWHLPRLGIAFVAMKRNFKKLPQVVSLAKQLGAGKISIRNVLPHTAELCKEQLYSRSMQDAGLQPLRWFLELSLPRMDISQEWINNLAQALTGQTNLILAGLPLTLGVNTCPFLEKESVSIRWDGAVSPCLPLLHTHESYLSTNRRVSQAFSFGSLAEEPLAAIWQKPEYVRFRERLREFDFSPCTFCNSCDMAESNTVDCFANDQPTCGGCLWAQGFIQCP